MTWQEELASYESLGCLHEIFERQVRVTPDATAVVDNDDRTMTFAELDEACNVLAIDLIRKGVVADSPVGIYMERCLEYVISYIAILKAGGAYIPLDVSYPDILLQDIFADAEPVCIITREKRERRLQNTNQQVIVLKTGWQRELKTANEGGIVPSLPKVKQDNLATIVYSSGTTGKPKGIMLPHRSPVYSYTWRHLLCPYEENEREACNVFFVWEMLRPLLKGICLYVIPDNVIYDPMLLGNFIKRHSITRILFTPSLLETILEARDVTMNDFASLKTIWFCGEVVTTSLLDRCISKMPWVTFYNVYSISECHDVAISNLNEHLKNQSVKEGEKRPKFSPVGEVCPGIRVVILDEENNPQPVGMPGEIYVGGPTLARGYLNRPEMNKKRFVTTPATVELSVGAKLYRTGDWGSVKSDGNLEICGRCDSMVKVRGYSIEIHAVEAALASLSTVKACVVLAIGDEGQDKQLVAYIVAVDAVTKKIIKDDLRKKLPFYMVPSYYIFLKSIPVVPATGKLDKKALPSIHSRRKSVAELFTTDDDDELNTPSTETEKFLEKIWCSLLQMEFIDVQESFFDLGGHSLLAARLLGSIREHYKDIVTMQVLFTYPTIRELAKWLDSEKNTTGEKLRHVLDLEAEVNLYSLGPVNLDIQLRAFWRSHRFGYKSHRARVLLTGATGFLGAFLLRELLLETKVQIYCLVRRLPDQSAEERLKKNLDFYQIFQEQNENDKDLLMAYRKRVHSMTGDVALFELGVSEEDYTYLCYEIDYVIHAAAYVNLVYPYEALKGTNVVGTQNVLKFARSGKIKPVHYISSNAVYPNNKIMCKEVATSREDAEELENGYGQSKWVAEQLVNKAISQGLPAAIYRIGNIAGSSSNLTTRWNPADFILLVLRASLTTSSWPKVDWSIELTPVDFVSKCVVQLSQELQSSLHKIFHVVQPNNITGKWLFKWLKSEFGYKLELVSMEEWCKRIENLPVSNGNSANGHPNVKKMLESVIISRDESLFGYNSTFDQTNLTKALESFGLSYPELNGKLIRKYITDLTMQNIIPAPIEKRECPLSERVAVITGASSGIGRAVAIHLAKAGVKVCVSARSVDKLQELKVDIEKIKGVVTLFQCDVTKRNQAKSLIEHTENLWGSVDILVNNAGLMCYTHMSNVMMDDWDRMIDINCKGVTNGVGAVLPGMIKRNRGHIINTSSDAGLVGFPGLAVYSGTKFFVEGFSQALRHEMVDKGIKVTCIQPGDVKTNIFNHTTDEDARKQYDGSSKCKILDPEDIARAVVYVVSQPDHVAINQLLIEPKEAPI